MSGAGSGSGKMNGCSGYEIQDNESINFFMCVDYYAPLLCHQSPTGDGAQCDVPFNPYNNVKEFQ